MGKKSERVVLGVSITVFMIAVLESAIYYASSGYLKFFQVLLILQNSIKAFTFSPTIGIKDVIERITVDTPVVEQVIDYLYVVGIFAAPICTATVVFHAIELFFRRRVHRRGTKDAERIVIFGYHPNVALMLQKLKKENKNIIHLITNEVVSEDEEIKLSRKGVMLHKANYLGMDGTELDELNQSVELEKAQSVILCENDNPNNFSLYLKISKENHLHINVKFYCAYESHSIMKLIEDYHDLRVTNENDSWNHNLVLFHVDVLKVRQMLEKHPLYSYQLDKLYVGKDITSKDFWDVHMLIVGYGRTGQQILMEALNLGVMSSSGTLLVDVVDYHASDRKNVLMNMFHSDFVTVMDDELLIEPPKADGKLIIRFRQLDIMKNEFRGYLDEISKEHPLTYVAICMRDAESSTQCMTEVERFVKEKQEYEVPVAVRFEVDEQIAKYLEENKKTYSGVLSIPTDREILSIEGICGKDYDEKAKGYHNAYNQIKIVGKNDAPSEHQTKTWNELTMLKQQSNRALCYHNRTKQLLVVYDYLMGKGEEKAKAFFKKVDPEETPLQYQNRIAEKYNQILQKYRKSDMFTYTDATKEYELKCSKEAVPHHLKKITYLNELAKLEHRRWCYFMALNGWEYADSKDENQKKTPYLCDWDKLVKNHPDMCVYDLIPVLIEAEKQEEKENV